MSGSSIFSREKIKYETFAPGGMNHSARMIGHRFHVFHKFHEIHEFITPGGMNHSVGDDQASGMIGHRFHVFHEFHKIHEFMTLGVLTSRLTLAL